MPFARPILAARSPEHRNDNGTYLHHLQAHKLIAWNELAGVVWAMYKKESEREASKPDYGFLQSTHGAKVHEQALWI